MSSLSSFASTNFNTTALNQAAMEEGKAYLCPRCGNNYEFIYRNNVFTGRVPLILHCKHTMCEECVRTYFSNREVTCGECQQLSPIGESEKRKFQQIFPVNFYLMGIMYYLRPNMNVISSKIELRPAGVNYKNKDKRQQGMCGSTSSLNSEAGDFWCKSFGEDLFLEKCSQVDCKKKATLHCAECDEVYCENCCLTIHKVARGLQKHKIASLKSDASLEITVKCSLHNDAILEFHCNPCNTLICTYCLIHNHKGHDFSQLTLLNDSEKLDFENLVLNAEEKLKKLLFAFKKIKTEHNQSRGSLQSSLLVKSIAKYFGNLHGRLQIAERKLNEDAKNVDNVNSGKLKDLGLEVLGSVHNLRKLINVSKSILESPSGSSKYNVKIIAERLQNSLTIPCYLVGEQQQLSDVGLNNEALNDLEKIFSIKFGNEDEKGYQLVSDDQLPEDYDTAMPDISLLDMSDVISESGETSDKSFSTTDVYSRSEVISSSAAHHRPTPVDSFHSGMEGPSGVVNMARPSIEKWVQDISNEVTKFDVPTLKRDSKEYVSVTHIDSPDCFYVQLCSSSSKLEALNHDLQQHIRRNFAPVSRIIEKNELYIVKYETKNAPIQWCRGRVIAESKDKYKKTLYTVLFIDYGNCQAVYPNLIRDISPTLSKPKPFAYKCKLFNVFPGKGTWDSNAIILMAQILTGVDTLMVVINNLGGILEVDLLAFNGGSASSMREALIFIGHAFPNADTLVPIDYLKMKNTKPASKLHTRTENYNLKQTMEVRLTHVVDPFHFYVQIADYIHHIDHLNDCIMKHFSKPQKGKSAILPKGENIYVPKKDMIVAVYWHSNNLWCRGTVQTIIEGQGMIEVVLVDYGRTVTVSYTDIRRLSEKFRALDCQALQMKLADVKPPNGSTVWDADAINFLLKYVNDKQTLRLVIAEPLKVPTVALFECYTTMDLCINAIMVQKKFAESTGKLSDTVEWLKDTPDAPKQEPSYVTNLISTIQSKVDNDSHSESDEENAVKFRLDVNILDCESPNEIFVARLDNKTKEAQRDLYQDLQQTYRFMKNSDADWDAGDLCVVYIKAKDGYFRASILEKVDELKFCIRLSDLGQKHIVSKSEIYELDGQFDHPNGAIRCHLGNIVPAGDSSKWSGLAVEFLNDIFMKYSTISMTKDGVVNTLTKSLPVIMWYTEIKPGKALEPSKIVYHNINKLLVKNGLALRKRVPNVIVKKMTSKDDDSSSVDTVRDVSSLPPKNKFKSDRQSLRNNKSSTKPKKSSDSDAISSSGDSRDTIHSMDKTYVRPLNKIPQMVGSSENYMSPSSSEDGQSSLIKYRKKSTIPKQKSPNEFINRSSPLQATDKHVPESWIDLVDQEEILTESSDDKALQKIETNDWLPAPLFIKRTFEAVATFVDDNAVIYLHELNLVPVLEKMEANMKQQFDEIPPEPVGTVWMPGQLCTVKYFVNESWYRGKIVKVMDDIIRVLMIDYGNEEDCKQEDLRFKVMYLDVPAMANRVTLYKVYPSSQRWLTSDLDELHRIIVEKQIIVNLKGKLQPNTIPSAVITINNINLNTMIVEKCQNLVSNLKHITSPSDEHSESDDVIIEEIKESKIATTNVDKEPDTSIPSVIRQFALPQAKYFHQELPQSLVDKTVPISIINVLHYNKIVFEMVDETALTTAQQFETMSADIKAHAEKQPCLIDIQIGQACVSRFSEDDEWYRAEIVSVEEDNVFVWYIDFGNFETAQKKTLRAIRPDWLIVPVMQYVGIIDGIEMAKDSQNEVVFERLSELCGSTKTAKILSVEPARLEIYNDDGQLAYQNVLNEGLLVAKNV